MTMRTKTRNWTGYVAPAVLMLLPWLPACRDSLGPCDEAAARELVYSTQGALVATKGQALLHDSCGQGVFCHAAAAKGDARYLAPTGMDYDMLPVPNGWPQVIYQRDAILQSVVSGNMPPGHIGQQKLANTEWVADLQLREGAPRLPSLATARGKAVLRNWLACGAPVVAATHLPDWARPADEGDGGPGALDWSELFANVVHSGCSSTGCHDASAGGRLAMVEECEAYRQLLQVGPCGKARLIPGDASSLLVTKLDAASAQHCGKPMPPAGPLASAQIQRIRQWVQAGAPARNCP